MVKLLFAVLVASFGIGLSERELPKDYQFKCQPKEGSGSLGVFEDWSKLNGEDYSLMLKFDSLRKVSDIVNAASLRSLKKMRETDAYKKLASYTCSKAYIDLDFYLDNAISLYQNLLKSYRASPPPALPPEKYKENFRNLTDLLFSHEKQQKVTNIKDEHARTDKSVNETGTAISSPDFHDLAEEVLQLDELLDLQDAFETLNISADHVYMFTEYYAFTYWKKASGNNSASFLSVPLSFYVICAFNIAAMLRLIP